MPPDLATRSRLRKVVHTAAVQPTSEQPSRAVTQRNWSAPGKGITDPRYLQGIGEWQDWLARFSQEMGIVRFSAGITADTAARVRWMVEKQNDDGEWEEAEDLNGILDDYRNELQGASDLTRLQAWHYEITGEMFEVLTQNQHTQEADWWIYGRHAVSFPDSAFALVKDIPNGQEKDGTAKRLPRDQVTRMWIPDEMYPGLATSPMRASVADLRRYQQLARYVERTIDSRLAMNGALWTPSEAHVERAADGATSKLDAEYAAMARAALGDEPRIADVVPFPIHYGNELTPPTYVEFGKGLDETAMSHRSEAREDFARGINLPSAIASEGGPGGGNHWSDWLVDEKFFQITIAPICDRIAGDRTRTFLWRKFLAEGHVPEADITRYRVNYDPAAVIVHPNRSDKAIEMLKLGAISFDAAREATDFTDDDAMEDEEEKKWLMEVIGKAQPGGNTFNLGPNGQPVGPENVTKLPPQQEKGAEPISVAASVRSITAGARKNRAEKLNKVVGKLQKIRADLGRKLLAASEHAMEEALRQAGVKVRTRANRETKKDGKMRPAESEATRAAVAACLDADDIPTAPLRTHLAILGISELQLLRNRFRSLGRYTAEQLTAAGLQQARALDEGSGGPVEFLAEQAKFDAASNFLVDALEHLAGRRLMDGALVEAAGEVSGLVPAALVRDAIRVAEGLAEPIYSNTETGEGPSVRELEEGFTQEQRVADEMGLEALWRWEHGFYGEPRTVFEPHLELNGFATDDPKHDDFLANQEEFPLGARYQPGDHDGCTCEWVPEYVDSAGNVVAE